MNVFSWRWTKINVVSMLLFAFFSLSAAAEEITLTASVDAKTITLGNSAHLILTVTGKQKVEQIPLPAIDGFETRYLGPQTQVSIVNGNYSSLKSFIYVLFSTKVGKFTIPSITAKIDGKEYTTDPIEITVEEADSAPQPRTQAKTSGSPSAVSLQDKIMLLVQSPSKEVYLHEQVPLHIKLFYGGVQISDVQFPILDTTGFTKTEFGEPEQTQQVLNGMGFNVVDFKTYISPTRTGELTIGPAQLQANLLSRSQNQGINGSFGTDLFDNFFTTYERRPFTVNSPSMTIKVLPLPEEGKPENFSGAVGVYEFDASATPVDVKIGDPITLRMKVSGDGDLKTITMPVFDDPAFKIYDPQIKDEGNTKVLEQVIIPTRTEIKEVPAVSFSYFDTQAKEYRTITKGPFSVIVTAPKPGDEFKAVGFETATPTVEVKEGLGRDIVFIKERLDDLRPKGYHLYNSIGFWLGIVVYGLLWVACLVVYFIRRKLKTDTRFARKFKAPRQVRLGLENARARMQEKNAKEFYAGLVKTLTEYVGNHLHVPSGGLTYDVLSRLLKERSVKDEIVAALKVIFETADRVRFASYVPDEKIMNRDFEALKIIIERLEKNL